MAGGIDLAIVPLPLKRLVKRLHRDLVFFSPLFSVDTHCFGQRGKLMCDQLLFLYFTAAYKGIYCLGNFSIMFFHVAIELHRVFFLIYCKYWLWVDLSVFRKIGELLHCEREWLLYRPLKTFNTIDPPKKSAVCGLNRLHAYLTHRTLLELK